jgi:hypothetical protein
MAISEKDLFEAGFSKSEVDNFTGPTCSRRRHHAASHRSVSRRFRVSA